MITVTLDQLMAYKKTMDASSQRRIRRIEDVTADEIHAMEDLPPSQTYPEAQIYPLLCGDPDLMMTMTGMTKADLEQLDFISNGIFEIKGRGQKTKFNPMDILILLLHYLKRYPKYEEAAGYFKIKTSTYQKLIGRAIDVAADWWKVKLIDRDAENEKLPTSEEFPSASYVVDATVQPIYVPIGLFEQKKEFFSGKHHIYCLKSQLIVDLKGAALHFVSGIPGSVHDMRLFRDNLEDFQRIIHCHPDNGEKILADKGYQANDLEHVLITPFKGKPLDLSNDQKDFNRKLGSERVIVENFFGRMKSKYAVMADKYRGDRETYKKLFCICVALMNFDIRHCGHPLRDSDGDWYERMMTADMIEALNERRDKSKKKADQREKRMESYSQEE